MAIGRFIAERSTAAKGRSASSCQKVGVSLIDAPASRSTTDADAALFDTIERSVIGHPRPRRSSGVAGTSTTTRSAIGVLDDFAGHRRGSIMTAESRSSIFARFRGMIERRTDRRGGAGTGLSAKCEEAEKST